MTGTLRLIAVILFAYFSIIPLSTSAQDAGSSFGERRIVPRKISGAVTCTEKKIKKPMKGAAAALVDYDKTIASVKTDKDGKFFLDVKVKEGERYEIKITSSCGDATKDFLIGEAQESNSMNFNFSKD